MSGLRSFLAVSAICFVTSPLAAEPLFQLPVECEFGQVCFVQQGPDTAPGPDIRDPNCGLASYDGHSGWDFRVRWMPDLGVPVVAAADGKVLRMRDGVPDKPVLSEDDRNSVSGKECGNGVVIAHGNGLQTQYCHMQRGSILVKSGDDVRAGQVIGGVGASGLAQFPHLHFSVRDGKQTIEPMRGLPLEATELDCDAPANSLMSEEARSVMAARPTAVIAAGLSSSVPSKPALLQDGPPPTPEPGPGTLIGWAWSINVEKGWRLEVRISDSSGRVLIEHITDPFPRRKADYFVYAGRRNLDVTGEYRLSVDILNGDTSVASHESLITID